MMQGIFLGIPLPEDQIHLFSQMLQELKQLALPVRYQKASTPHFTLLYLGQVHEDKLSKIKSKTQAIAVNTSQFRLGIDKLGYFGSSRYPRVAWLGIEHNAELISLQSQIKKILGVHCSKKDDRPFHAHLTIARIDSSKKFLSSKTRFEQIVQKYSYEFTADRIRLYHAIPQENKRQIPLTDFMFNNS